MSSNPPKHPFLAIFLLLMLFATSVMGYMEIFDNYMPNWIAGILGFYSACGTMILIAGLEEE